MVPFTGYCDESEKPKSDILVAAGLIAPTNRWIQFEYNWKLALAHNHVSYFHAREFYNHKGPWKRGTKWDNERRCGAFIADLLSVLQATETKPDVAIVSAVGKKSYQQIFPKHDIVKQTVGTAYTVACAGCWILGARWANEYLKSEKVFFFFDDGHHHAKEALIAYQKAKKYPPLEKSGKLGGLAFVNDLDYVPLQAADLLAYGVMQNIIARGYTPDIEGIVKQYTGGRFEHMVIGQGETLREIRAEHVRLLRERGKIVPD